MQTTLTIECDIKEAQAILYSASKIIRNGEANRDQERLDELNNKISPFTIVPDKEQEAIPETQPYTLPAVTCPHCDWVGGISELRVGKSLTTLCPKCSGFIGKPDFLINIYKFMELEDTNKTEYICVDEDGNEYDIKIFDRTSSSYQHLYCETCGVGVNMSRKHLIGTSDTREPKYCYGHYIILNKNSRFIRKGVV